MFTSHFIGDPEQVLNRDFCETCSISADLRSVLFMLFNPIRDELITGGVEGTRVCTFSLLVVLMMKFVQVKQECVRKCVHYDVSMHVQQKLKMP